MISRALKEYEVNCKRCDKSSMVAEGSGKLFVCTNGEIYKVLVKCRICGRISYILRPTE
jgi:ribosomal protein L37E